MSNDLLKISTGMAIKEEARKERLDAFALYVSPLPWFNIDLLHKIYINIFEKYFTGVSEKEDPHPFEMRSITCADLIRCADVVRIDYNAFELEKTKRELFRKEINKQKEVIKEIGKFMIAYSETNHHHFLSPRYREVLNIEGRIIIDPSSAASEISSHISNQLNQGIDPNNTVKTAEYYLNIINKTNKDQGIKELKKYLEGTREWAKGNTEKALKMFQGLTYDAASNEKTITVKLPQSVQQEIKANFEKLSKQDIIDKIGRGICAVMGPEISCNGILLNGGYVLTLNRAIKTSEDALNTRISFRHKISDLDLDSTYGVDGRLDPSTFFITMPELVFTIVKIKDSSMPTLGIQPVPTLSTDILNTGQIVNTVQITPDGNFQNEEGKILEIFDTSIYYGITSDSGYAGSPVFDPEGKVLGMKLSGKISKEGFEVEAIRTDAIALRLSHFGLDINNLAAQVKSSDLHCILVGNNEYRASNIYPLRGAINDAKRMRHFIQSNLSYASLKLIQNGTKQEIVEAFDWVKKELKDGDTLLFYYAGYGGIEEGYYEKLTKFIATSDTYSDKRETNRLSHFELQYLYKQCFEKDIQVVSILDCGYHTNPSRETNETIYYRSLPEKLQGRSASSMIYDEKFRPGEVFNYNFISVTVAKENQDVLESVTGGKFMDHFPRIMSGQELDQPKVKATKLPNEKERGKINLLQFESVFNIPILEEIGREQTIELIAYADHNSEVVLFKDQFLFGDSLVERRISNAKNADELDLSGIALEEVPHNIHELDGLRHLDLSKNKIKRGFHRLLINEQDKDLEWRKALQRLNKLIILNVEDNPIENVAELALLIMICKETRYSDDNLDEKEREFLIILKLVVPGIYEKTNTKLWTELPEILGDYKHIQNSANILGMLRDKSIGVEDLVKLLKLIIEVYVSLNEQDVQKLHNVITALNPDANAQNADHGEQADIPKTQTIDTEELRELIARNKTDEVFKALFRSSQNYSKEIQSSITNLQSQFFQLKQNIRLGVLSYSEQMTTQSNISFSIIELLDAIETPKTISRVENSNQDLDWASLMKNLTKLLAENKADQVLNQLSNLSTNLSRDFQNNVLMLQAQNEQIEDNNRKGIISAIDYGTDKNRLSRSILELLNSAEIEEKTIGIRKSTPPTDKPKTSENLIALITSGKLDAAISELATLSKNSTEEAQNLISSISSNYDQLKRKNLLGLIMNDEYNRELNKITLNLLDSIRFMDEKKGNDTKATSDQSQLNIGLNDIKMLIANDKLDEAISLLSSLPQTTTIEFQNSVILLESQLNRLQKSINLGLITSEDSTLQKNKIISSLLDLVTTNFDIEES